MNMKDILASAIKMARHPAAFFPAPAVATELEQLAAFFDKLVQQRPGFDVFEDDFDFAAELYNIITEARQLAGLYQANSVPPVIGINRASGAAGFYDTPEGKGAVMDAMLAASINTLPFDPYDIISDLPPCSGSVVVNHANGDIDRIGFISGVIRDVPEDSAVSALFESPAGEGHASSPTPPAYPDAEHCEHNNDGDDICTRCGADLNLSRREGEGISRQRQRLMHLQERLAYLRTPAGLDMNPGLFIIELMAIQGGMLEVMQVDYVERQMCSGSKLTGGAAS